ncbi:MAG: ABC transporter ATP-binding protein [Deltaproteobacteria bacterium]|nr:ABC transporter ATP-binding protein [Deltaproteobacteria bacterium]
MLRIEQVDGYYLDFQALWDISLTVEKEEIVALIGSNGSGKSSVLRAISGFLKPEKGTITIEGEQIQKMPPQDRVRLGISLVPEGRRLFPEMTVLENLEMGAYIKSARKAKEETLEWVFQTFPRLKDRTGQTARTLSGGEQQMLAIARGLMSRPKLLLVDEVSLGLAPIIVQSIYKTLQEINRTLNMTILLVEQNVRMALDVAHKGYVIENGRIVGQGTAQELLNDEQVKNAYLALS